MATDTKPYARSKGRKVRTVRRSDSEPTPFRTQNALHHPFTQSLETLSLERPKAKRSGLQSRAHEGNENCRGDSVQGQHIPILQRQVGQGCGLHELERNRMDCASEHSARGRQADLPGTNNALQNLQK